ncbi:hypothetical protein ACFW6V_28505 [Streptomyces sp. NPDC058734]|uniref:hypothetical protein n=1 Tax=Streptomyces sp. NPDC058734 TaxID=3346615 RepID=UPI0036B690A3
MHELQRRLQQLMDAARSAAPGATSFRALDRYGRQNNVGLAGATVKGWLQGSVPKDGAALFKLVQYLEPKAQKAGTWQRLPEGGWQALYRQAQQGKTGGAPAPKPNPIRTALPATRDNDEPSGEPTCARPGDVEKAQRILSAFPPDAPWFTAFEHQTSFHRMRDSVQDPLYAGQNALARNYKVRFLDADLQRQSEKFHDTVNAFLHSLDQMDADGVSGYSEIPIEWRRSFPDEYARLRNKLSEQRDALIAEYGVLINMFNERDISLVLGDS